MQYSEKCQTQPARQNIWFSDQVVKGIICRVLSKCKGVKSEPKTCALAIICRVDVGIVLSCAENDVRLST